MFRLSGFPQFCKYLGLDGILGFCLKKFLILAGEFKSETFQVGALVSDASCLHVILFFFFFNPFSRKSWPHTFSEGRTLSGWRES